MPSSSSAEFVRRLPSHQSASTGVLSVAAIDAARIEVSCFVLTMAARTAAETGFGWVGRPTSPLAAGELRSAYARSAITGQPLSVSDLHLDSTIYVNREAALASRFWHDVDKVRRGRGVDTAAELDLGLYQLAIAEVERLSPVAIALLEVDRIGQTLLFAAQGCQPVNQYAFVLDALSLGIADAIVLEAERQPVPAASQGL